MKAVQLREKDPTVKVLVELMEDYDQVMEVDCADRRSTFSVMGYFCFPKRSLVITRHDQPG